MPCAFDTLRRHFFMLSACSLVVRLFYLSKVVHMLKKKWGVFIVEDNLIIRAKLTLFCWVNEFHSNLNYFEIVRGLFITHYKARSFSRISSIFSSVVFLGASGFLDFFKSSCSWAAVVERVFG